MSNTAVSLKSSPVGHRARLRERVAKNGLQGFHDYEILELLLTYALPRIDTKPLAKELVGRFQGISGVLNASKDELLSVKGLGPRAVELLTLMKPIGQAYLRDGINQKNLLNCPEAVAQYCRMTLAGEGHERVLALYVDARNCLLAERMISLGTIDQAAVHPRRIIEEALACHAAGLILVHNHTSGQVDPSSEDRELTKRVAEACRLFDLNLLDHLIVSQDGHTSFRRVCWLDPAG